MKVALISYFFEPYTGVGVIRPAYWARHISELDSSIVCDVITAQEDAPDELDSGKVKVIKILPEKGSLLSKIRIDAGVNWKKPLEKFFAENKGKYDALIFTGGPFMHFFAASGLKCKIIFDFRDPFANNPNHNLNKFKRFIKRMCEKKLLKIADVSITVNEICRNLMEDHEKRRIEIIDNGYDESVIDICEKRAGSGVPKKIVYAGKFYAGISPDVFLNVLAKDENLHKFSFDYMGQENEKTESFNRGNFNVTSSVPYSEAVSRISLADIGIIFTGGKPFESTTKIFDYIGLEKTILVVTEGEPETGNIHEISKDYPNIFWCRNNEASIQKTLDEIYNFIPKPYPEKEKLSRREGLKKLIGLLHE